MKADMRQLSCEVNCSKCFILKLKRRYFLSISCTASNYTIFCSIFREKKVNRGCDEILASRFVRCLASYSQFISLNFPCHVLIVVPLFLVSSEKKSVIIFHRSIKLSAYRRSFQLSKRNNKASGLLYMNQLSDFGKHTICIVMDYISNSPTQPSQQSSNCIIFEIFSAVQLCYHSGERSTKRFISVNINSGDVNDLRNSY